MRSLLLLLALTAFAACPACGGSDEQATATPTNELAGTPLAAPRPAACTSPSATPLGDLPPEVEHWFNTIVDADGDGTPEEAGGYFVPSEGRYHVRLTFDDGYVVDVLAPALYTQATPLGGHDIDGDGTDEIMIGSGAGAYATLVAIVDFDPESCELAPVVFDDGSPLQAPVGASVGNIAGLECFAAGDVHVLNIITGSSEDGITYAGHADSYELNGAILQHIAGADAVFTTAEEIARASSLTCGVVTVGVDDGGSPDPVE